MAIAPNIYHGNLVAGAAAEGNGVLVGWSGRGELTRARLIEIATGAGLPVEWCPRAKDPAVQLTRAVRAAAGGLYNAEQPPRPVELAPGERAWTSRWVLVQRALSDLIVTVGATYGQIALVATLYGDTLEIESEDEVLARRVRDDFQARIDGERFVAADVTAWLVSVLRENMDAVRYGGNWYIPRVWRSLAETLCTAFQTAKWGHNWMVPALPIATSAQLSAGLAHGLEAEVDEVLADIFADRARAKEEGRLDIGQRAAETFMVRLRGVGQRVVGYTDLLGGFVDELRFRIHDAMIELDKVLDGGLDFAQQWAMVERERAANGGPVS